MPLKAFLNEEKIYSFAFSEEDWISLKKQHKKKELTMPCCDSKAIPKTSRLGTHYFSHYLKGNCDFKGESMELLTIKDKIAKAAYAVGWHVETEMQGTSKNNEDWTADVYCRWNHHRVVFEVLLSQETPEELEIKNQKYIDSDIKAFWFQKWDKRKYGKPVDNPYGLRIIRLPYELNIDNIYFSKQQVTIEEVVKAILRGNFKYHSGDWKI